MIDKKEKNIFKFLDITYGKSEFFENEEKICINGVCVYFKNTKQVGFTGQSHLDLVNWFGEGKYYSVMQKWFYKKYNLGS